MEIIIYFLFFVVMITNSMGRREEVNSFQLKSKIFRGILASKVEEINQASLQLNGHHICTSGIVGANLLVTSAKCVSFIKDKIEHKENPEHGTAVLGHIDLNEGDRYDIENLVHHHRYVYSKKGPTSVDRNVNYDFGIVLLNRIITSEFAISLPLYKSYYNARDFKNGIVSGWGTVQTDDRTSDIGTKHVERNLHYMKIQLRGPDFCRGHIQRLNFNVSLICGMGKMDQKTAKGDIGSPLVKKVLMDDGEYKDAIIGITSGQWEDEKISLTYFVRISCVYDEIDSMLNFLKENALQSENRKTNSQHALGQKGKNIQFFKFL